MVTATAEAGEAHFLLKVCERSALPFIGQLRRPFPKLLLDTTVYIDELQGNFPQEEEVLQVIGKRQ
jgi:hypothetical protein